MRQVREARRLEDRVSGAEAMAVKRRKAPPAHSSAKKANSMSNAVLLFATLLLIGSLGYHLWGASRPDSQKVAEPMRSPTPTRAYGLQIDGKTEVVGLQASGEQAAAVVAPAPPQPEQSSNRLGGAVAEEIDGRAASASELAAFLHSGARALEQGDVASARSYFRAAFDGGAAAGAAALGGTFDPLYLADLAIQGLRPDHEQAIVWYRRAAQAGDPDAGRRLDALLQWRVEQER